MVTKTYNWPFWLVGMALMIFVLDIVWWQALLVGLVFSMRVTIKVDD